MMQWLILQEQIKRGNAASILIAAQHKLVKDKAKRQRLLRRE